MQDMTTRTASPAIERVPLIVGHHVVGRVSVTRTPAGALVLAVPPGAAARALADEILVAVARQEGGQ